jgi:RNA polymerase sigma factor (sigma-70 family)
MSERRETILPTRRSLLTRLKDWDDQEGWRRFFDTYWRLIYGVARQAGLTDAESQDVVQETILSVAKQMRDFRYDSARGTFKSWLRLLTRRRIADFQRRQYRQVQCVEPNSNLDPARTALVERVADASADGLESVWDLEWQKHILETAIRRVQRQVDARQFQMFACYVLKGWAPTDVARKLGVSIGQVYLAKHRVGIQVRKEIERLELGLV